MNATSHLVYPGPTMTHRFPCIASLDGGRFGTLIGWAETADIARLAASDFLASEPVSFEDLMFDPETAQYPKRDDDVTVHKDGTLSAGRFVEFKGDRIIVDHGDSTSAVPVGSPVWFVTDVHGRVLGAEDAS